MVSPVGSASYIETNSPVKYVHTISEAGRLLPSSSQWNSIELEFGLFPQSSSDYGSLPSRYSKSFQYELIVTDKQYFKRFLYILGSSVILIIALVLLVLFLPRKHHKHGDNKNLTLAVNQALTFYDAQKSGIYPKKSPVKFRGDSGLRDGNSSNANPPVDLVGGFYDSGNNMKFTFPTAYTITLLSWTVIEYHQKYDDIHELAHVKDIIKWGTEYLLKVFVPPMDATSGRTILYSQVGVASNKSAASNDMTCWQRPEDMDYDRPVSVCDGSASDLAGEIVAALSAASMVFKEDDVYSRKLAKAAEKLFEVAWNEDPHRQGTYTRLDDACGGESRTFYNSSGHIDELVWGGTWLSFATGNLTYLDYATKTFDSAKNNVTSFDRGVFYWNNKLTAIAVLFTRLRFFYDLGYPFEDALAQSSDMIDSLMCSYLGQNFDMTPGGLIIQRPENGAPLQFAATASFLSKLYSDYLEVLLRSGGRCSSIGAFTVEKLREFSKSQVNYILGDNPMKMSYMVGFGDKYPNQVHHRSASIPWDGKHYSCEEGEKWLKSKEPNPNVVVGAMVGGPNQFDNFTDERERPLFTEPSISSNAGLVAALIALHHPPRHNSGNKLGLDQTSLFENIRL
nr:endoglucanase 25-like [Ziziphus jujuba var. spinosa]